MINNLRALSYFQVNGERHPAEVYKDFKDAVIKILGMQDNPPALGNGREAAVPVDITSELPTMVNSFC